jgi:hypothetical protein
MPTDLADVETGGATLLFADDLSGTVLKLRENAVYDAEEVRVEIGGDVPKFGNWLPVDTESEGECWAVALGELVEELQQYENPSSLELKVTRCEKSGDQQTDPYEVNVEVVDGDPQQTGL